MEARPEFLPIPKVQLKETFWVTEDSMAKLLMAGAKYVDDVVQKNHYYDTASDDLAMAGLWLSRRDQEWFLIVESQKEGTQEELEELSEEKANNPVPDLRETLFQKVTDDVQWDNALACRKPSKEKIEEAEAPLKTQYSKAEESEHPKFTSAFTELVGESEITAYLTAHLHLDVNAEGGRGNATMEGFLQKAGIEHYASSHVVNQATYLLSDRYTVIIQRGEEGSLRESATVGLEVNVFNVCEGLEEIEKLAAYLGFERPGVQNEREFMA